MACMVTNVNSEQLWFSNAITLAFKNQNLAFLEVLFGMKDFNMYHAKNGQALSQVWSKQVSLEFAHNFLDFLFIQHNFDMNKSKDFCEAMLKAITLHSNASLSIVNGEDSAITPEMI